MSDHPYPTWQQSDRVVPRRFIRPVRRFMQYEASSGAILLVAAVLALIWANSAWYESYFDIFGTHFDLSFGPLHLEETFKEIINDGLMAVFFFVVGLEIKRELVIGELRDPKTAALPVVAALGGMVVPALIYVAFVAGGPGVQGWGIPMATDIAFSIGVVALLGTRVPTGAKLFLLTLAIADDIGAITVIAVFYTDELALGWLIAGIVGLGIVAAATRAKIRSMAFYVPAALAIWFFVLQSGVHATLAGVALGFLTPARPFVSAPEFDRRARRILDVFPALASTQTAREKVDHEARMLSAISHESIAPLNRLEYRLLPWSSFVVVPLFALANAGVRFVGLDLGAALTEPISLGVSVGLVVGKLVGISLFAWLAVAIGLGKLPLNTTWQHVIGLAALAGIGFTVSLFVAGLAFDDAVLADQAKIGIFVGSTVAGLIGTLILRAIGRAKTPTGARVDDAPVAGS